MLEICEPGPRVKFLSSQLNKTEGRALNKSTLGDVRAVEEKNYAQIMKQIRVGLSERP